MKENPLQYRVRGTPVPTTQTRGTNYPKSTRTGVCFDNAMAESFWSTLKTEFYDRKRWPTRDAARKAVAYWMEVVYNRRRRHSALGMVSPVDFENHIGLTTSRKEIAA